MDVGWWVHPPPLPLHNYPNKVVENVVKEFLLNALQDLFEALIETVNTLFQVFFGSPPGKCYTRA